MRYRIRSFLLLHRSTGLALLGAVLLGACALPNPETIRTRNLLASAGFHPQKPETPEQREIYVQMPAFKLEGGLVHGEQLYSYKVPAEDAVYVGGEAEYQQYERLLSRWKKAEGSALGHKSLHGGFAGDPFGQRSYWLQQDLNR